MDDLIIHSAPQGTADWLAARKGVINGSRLKDCRDRLKNGAPSKKCIDYALDVAREREGGEAMHVYVNGAMRLGTEQAPYARAVYERKTGSLVEEAGCYVRKLPPDISYRSLMIWLKKGTSAIGRPGLRLHDLRHSAASGMVQAGVPLYTAGKVLGHKSQASTARYSHLGTQDLHDALAAISKKSVGRS